MTLQKEMATLIECYKSARFEKMKDYYMKCMNDLKENLVKLPESKEVNKALKLFEELTK